MTPYIPTIFFIAGLLTGVVVTCLGLYLGFKASFDIRSIQTGIDDGPGLLQNLKNPAEFDLLEDVKQEREQ